MSSDNSDPFGQAILDFDKLGQAPDIIVSSDICDDDTIPVSYLFRSYSEMPELEKVALSLCEGKILDVGAAAGKHAEYLLQQGKEVTAIDISPGSIRFMKSRGIPCALSNFFDINEGAFDTLFFMMNGIGIAGSLAQLEVTLTHAKRLVTARGKIICDSTDIKYLYEDEDGGMWLDVTNAYYGNFRFQMRYKEHISDWFDWLYVDFEQLQKIALRAGWKAEKRFTDGDHYLAELTQL
jgi:SAM-dependent methyltransferase